MNLVREQGTHKGLKRKPIETYLGRFSIQAFVGHANANANALFIFSAHEGSKGCVGGKRNKNGLPFPLE